MLYEPTHLNEFHWEELDDFAIWRENGTLICISKRTFAQYEQRNVYVLLGGGDFPLNFAIYGATDAAIAESFTLFCSLQDSGETEITLLVGAHVCYKKEYHFDFSALPPAQLAQILDANPKRRFEFHTGLWNAKQAVILATRPYPLHLVLSVPILAWLGVFPLPCFSFEHLKEFAFMDGGTAFVDALTKRQSSFGYLRMDRMGGSQRLPLSNPNLRRLFKLPVFESLKTDYVDKGCALLPFSMKVKALDYHLKAEYVRPKDFKTLDIATKDLTLQMHLGQGYRGWDDRIISFFNRMAALGHFERLRFSLEWDFDPRRDGDDYTPIREALVAAINANQMLYELDLRVASFLRESSHINAIFHALEDHKGIRSLTLDIDPIDEDDASERAMDIDPIDEDDPRERRCRIDFSSLERLLTRNRNITVFHSNGEKITNGSSIDRLYSLNARSDGSARALKRKRTET